MRRFTAAAQGESSTRPDRAVCSVAHCPAWQGRELAGLLARHILLIAMLVLVTSTTEIQKIRPSRLISNLAESANSRWRQGSFGDCYRSRRPPATAFIFSISKLGVQDFEQDDRLVN